jgi:hypothetical protein
LRPFYLILFPLLFLVATGFMYTTWNAWNSTCYGDITCSGAAPSAITTSDPLFDILSGNWNDLGAALAPITIGSAWSITIPFLGFGSTLTIPSVPYVLPYFHSYYIQYPTVWIPNGVGGSFEILSGGFYMPWVAFESITWVPPSIPWFSIVNYTIPIPFGTWIVQLIAGGLMIAFSMGIGSQWLNVNDQGTKLIQALGIGILLWTFIGLFFTAWLATLPYGTGTVILSILELVFLLGIYWQSQTTI